MTLINRNLRSLDLWSKNLGQGYTLPTSTMSIKYAKTEPLGERNIVWTRNLQKSSVLTLTGNLKHWLKVNVHQFKPRERKICIRQGFPNTNLLDLASRPRNFVQCQFIFFTQRHFVSKVWSLLDQWERKYIFIKLYPRDWQKDAIGSTRLLHNHGTFNNIVLERFLLIIGTQRIFYCYKYFKHKCYI